MSLIGELKRRNVFKAGAAYLVVAWLAVQAASIGFPAFEAPPWVLRVFILVALLGFPVTLVMAWIFEVTPEGMKLDTAARGSKRLFAVAGVFAVLALAWYFVGQPATRVDQTVTEAAKPEAATGTSASPDAAPARAIPAKSIAVLPFADLSPEGNQAYFSDGMAEEILNALAKVKDLKVAGRTSSFAYKGRNVDLREVGAALAVAHVLEGSVRKQGERVRITAQLIKADDGYHVWSQTYDGDLADVFDLQERIARAITSQLEVVLQGDQQQRLVPVATTNADAYALYLEASDIFNRRDGKRWAEGLAKLDQAVALDPDYARAHARYATMLSLARVYLPEETDIPARVRAHAQRATALDPKLAEPHAALAQGLGREWRYVESRESFERALALEPNDATARFWYAIQLVQTGYLREGDRELERVLAIEPRHPNALFWLGIGYFYTGDRANAERVWALARDSGHSFVITGTSYLSQADGRIAQAIEERASGYRALYLGLSEDDALVLVRGELGTPEDRAAANAWIDRLLADESQPVPGVVGQGILRMGEADRLMRATRRPTTNDAAFLSLLWYPIALPIRRHAEFPQLVERMGMTKVWDRYGAPDLCRKSDDGRWTCD